MMMVEFCGLLVVASLPQCMVCWSMLEVVGCASPLLDHFDEKVDPTDPKILSCSKGKKKPLKFVGHVIGDEKYECV